MIQGQPPAVEQPSEDQIARCLDEAMSPEAPHVPGRAEQVNLIGLLQTVQGHFGYLPPAALSQIARRGRIPLSRIYGVVSFYSQFYTTPRGKHTIRCCRGTACHVKGAARVLETVRRTLGIDEGQTTPDMLFYLETVACLGACFLAPAMMIDNQYYGKLVPRRIESILRSYQARQP